MYLMMGLFSMSSAAQEQTGDREPYAAGKFYIDNPVELREQLGELFKKARPKQDDHVRAIIVPHAGYVFSGEVAASGFNQIPENANYDNVFVMASSHREAFKGASIYAKGDYITPLGKVRVNKKLAEELIRDNDIFSFQASAHKYEHSLEVQLPFLQYHLKNDFQIVPIVAGTQKLQDCAEIADALRPYFNENNLFVISTDFSHYPAYEDAKQIDSLTAAAITKNSVDALEQTLSANSSKNIDNLATSLCGWSSVFALLNLTRNQENLVYEDLQYMNSGDQAYGDKQQVVGYYSIAVYEKKKKDQEFELSAEDKKRLLSIARKTIKSYITEGNTPDIKHEEMTENLRMPLGAFVTLHKDGELRGCIGRFQPEEPLYAVVQQMAIAAATQDRRFSKVEADELKDIEIEVSVLTPMKRIDSIDEIELGKHGIYIKKGYASGTFLPQVADKTNWTLEEFLGHCAKDKARIGWKGWKNAEIYIYEALIFKEGQFD